MYPDPAVAVLEATDDGSRGHHGYVTDLVLANVDEKTVYLRMPPTYLESETLLMVLRNLLRGAHDRETNPSVAPPAAVAPKPVLKPQPAIARAR